MFTAKNVNFPNETKSDNLQDCKDWAKWTGFDTTIYQNGVAILFYSSVGGWRTLKFA